MKTSPLIEADASMRQIAHELIAEMRHAVLALLDAASGHPHLSRIACQPGADGTPLAFLSALAAHSDLLRATPRAGLLIEATPGRGDPMTQPRLSLRVHASPLKRDEGHQQRIDRWVQLNPKARIYADLPDFTFWRLEPVSGLLNAGFGRACTLSPDQLIIPPA